MGYYIYSFDKIRQVNTIFGPSKTRVIENYRPPGNGIPSIVFTANKYWYNTAIFNAAIETRFKINKSMKAFAGFDISNFLSFSQHYDVNYPPNHVYKRNQIRLFGIGAGAQASLLKSFGKISLGPIVSLPLFEVWKKDHVFPQEDNDQIRSKWFGGFDVKLFLINLLHRVYNLYYDHHPLLWSKFFFPTDH